MNGLVKAFHLQKRKGTSTSRKKKFYRVVAGSFTVRKNADAQVKRLKGLGIDDVFIDVFER